MNSFTTLSNSTEHYQSTLENIDKILNALGENNYHDALEGILKYDETGKCVTFFGEGPVTEEKIHQKEEEIGQQLQTIEKVKTTLEQDTKIPKALKDIYIRKVISLEKGFTMFQSALWLEAEKSGYTLSDEQRNHYQQQVAQQQNQIYGERVSDTPEEVKAVLTKLHNFSPEEKARLNEEEQQLFSTFLQEMDKKFQFDSTENVQPKATETSTISLPKEKNISPEELYDLTTEILHLYKRLYAHNQELQQWVIAQDPNRNFINVSGKEKVVSIPTKYNNVDPEKVTRTIASHEIEQHVIQRINNHTLFGKAFIGGERYDFVSEGVATFNEDIATGKINNFSDIQNAKSYFSEQALRIFIGENYNYEESVNLIKIYKKLTVPNESDAEHSKFAVNRARRMKRFVSYQLPGASLKDTYHRGKNRVIDYLTDYGKDTTPEFIIQRYRNLYIGKLGPNDIPHLPEIKQALSITDDQIVVPYFIGRILADKYNKKTGSIKDYLLKVEDYPLTSAFTGPTKRKLITILQGIKKSEKSSND